MGSANEKGCGQKKVSLIQILSQNTLEPVPRGINHLLPNPLPMSDLQKIVSDYSSTYAAVKEEEKQREQIKGSVEYMNLRNEIEELEKKQEAMTSHITDSSDELKMDKLDLSKHLIANNMTELDGFTVKIRRKNEVDVMGVLRAMEGDMDNLILVTTVAQKSLEKFWKENPTYKKDLKKCVVEVGFSVTDIIPLSE